jgi:hypothetical protein
MTGSSTITLEEVIDVMESGRPFDLVYVTADETRGTGGDIIERKGWVICNKAALPTPILRRNKIKPVDKADRLQANTNRLIYHPASQKIRAVHLRLICQFNSKRVV